MEDEGWHPFRNHISEMSSAIEESKSTPADLPPPRDRKGLRPVSPPLSNVPIRKFNNYMALFATLVFAYYIWRIVQWKTEVGGWWNLALGKRPPIQGGMQAPGSTGGIYPQTGEAKGDSSVEERINELAAALGLASKDLASAIADAVREHVPPASLSSVAAHQTGYVSSLNLRQVLR